MKKTQVSEVLVNLLNQGIARELQVSIQYMWQHVQWMGVKGLAVKDELKKIAIAEMKHAETIAERLVYLGGVPNTKPSPIFVGPTLKEMIAKDMEDEENAIVLYRSVIEQARKEGDETTMRIFQQILADEEDHHGTFEGILADL